MIGIEKGIHMQHVKAYKNSFFLFVLYAKRDCVGKIGGKSGLQKKWLKIVKTVFFG